MNPKVTGLGYMYSYWEPHAGDEIVLEINTINTGSQKETININEKYLLLILYSLMINVRTNEIDLDIILQSSISLLLPCWLQLIQYGAAE